MLACAATVYVLMVGFLFTHLSGLSDCWLPVFFSKPCSVRRCEQLGKLT